MEDKELIERARQWDEKALMWIYDRYAPKLYRYALHLLGDEDEAEECVAEVFVRLLLALRKGRGPNRNIQGYLFRMTHNWIQDYFRSRGSMARERAETVDVAAPLNQGPDAMIERKMRAETLRALLARLPERQALVLVLRFFEGWSLEEIASMMDLTVGAVKALQHRGLERLRQHLQATQDDWP